MGVPAAYLKKGALVGTPASDEVAIIADADGTIKILAPDGTRTTIGGGGAVHVTTLGAPSTSLTVSGLDPATEGDYDLFAVIQIAQANTSIKLQPNGADTNCSCVSSDNFVGAARTANAIQIGNVTTNPIDFAAGNVVVISGRVFAKAGRIRFFDLMWHKFTGAATDTNGPLTGYWNDTSTALASLVILSDVASGLGTGSFLRLTAVPQSA